MRLASMRIFNSSVSLLFAMRMRDMACPRQEIAAASCFCLNSIALSRFTTGIVAAAFISAFNTGGSIRVQFAGVKYLNVSSLRDSFDNPLTAVCSNLTATSLCMFFPYWTSKVGSSPNISKAILSSSGSGACTEVDGLDSDLMTVSGT